MPKFSGSFSGQPSWQKDATVADVANHQLSLNEISGKQKCDDEMWNGCTVSYWSTIDVVDGNGMQRGYYVNDHGAQGRDWGTFEGKVTTSGGQTTVAGTWKCTGGAGSFSGMTGNGTYKTRVVSQTQMDSEWAGTYEMSAARGAGR